MNDERSHWDERYGRRSSERLSWYEDEPRLSLAMVEASGLGHDAGILDVGGGSAALAGELVQRGYGDVTVADISEAALEGAKRRNGPASDEVDWLVADVRNHDFGRRFDLWHDRALFHFMVDAPDRDSYIGTLRRFLRPGGQAVIATFGPDGPTQCSGLPVNRYSAESLAEALGPEFELLDSDLQVHRTPGGSDQQFLWTRLRRR